MAYRYETHLHTRQGSACGTSSGAEHARHYLDAGYQGIFVTDHFFRGNTAIDRSLPAIEVGDMLVIHDTGAHGHSMGYNYNGKLRSAEVLLKEDGSFQLIRRAETTDDYFATFDMSPFQFGK